MTTAFCLRTYWYEDSSKQLHITAISLTKITFLLIDRPKTKFEKDMMSDGEVCNKCEQCIR